MDHIGLGTVMLALPVAMGIALFGPWSAEVAVAASMGLGFAFLGIPLVVGARPPVRGVSAPHHGSSTTCVLVRIRRPEAGAEVRTIDLGAFHAAWGSGVTLGSDPGCTVILPDLPPIAARLTAASNHRYLQVFPQGVSRRVDRQEFGLGPYRIRIIEASSQP